MKPSPSLAIRAAATVEQGDGSKPRTFKVAPAYSGGELRVAGYEVPVVVDLAGMQIEPRVVANLDHNPEKRVGHVTEAKNTGRALLLEGLVSAASESAAEFVDTAGTGFPWQASVEVQPSQLVEVRAGERVSVNGRTFQGPLKVARKSTLVGIAFVSRGADSTTAVIVASNLERVLAMEVSGEFTGKIEGSVNSNNPDSGEGLETPTEVTAAAILATERERLAQIENLCDPGVFDTAEAQAKVRRIKASAVAGKYTLDQVRQKVLELVRGERPQAPAVHASSRDGLDTPILAAALCQSLRIGQKESGYDERTYDAAHRAFNGRLGLQQVLIMAAAANGYQARPGERLSNRSLRTVLAYALPSAERQIDAAFSTVSLPGILSNVANKELLLGYQGEDQSWREISATKSVSDFKQATSYRLLDDMEYELLPKGGKIKHGAVGEESYTRQARTYAKMLSLTREDIINDDLSAFDDLRNRLGRGAARKFNGVFWKAFLDNSTFFTSGRGNYLSGADTALAVDGGGLEEAVVAFRQLRTPEADGAKRIGGKPEILLVPPELEFIARRLFQLTNTTGGSTATQNENIHMGLYRPVVVDQLSDDDFTGYSAKAWYLFRSPSLLAPMVVSFLDGVETPTVESTDADFDQLGIQFRGYHDFGCDKAEYLAGIKCKGEA